MFLTKKTKNKQAFSNGLIALIDKNYPLAIELLTKAAELDHHNAAAFLVLGNIYRIVGQASRAINIHEPLTLRKNLTAQEKLKVFLALAKDYQAIGHIEKTIEHYRKAIALDSKNIAVKKALFYFLEKQKLWDEAYAIWESVRKLDKDAPKSTLAYLEAEMAKTAFENGDNRSAEKKAKQALNLYPECVPAKLLKGDLYQAAKKDEAAFKEWAEIIDLNPRLAFLTYSRLEKNLFKRNNYDKMLELYQKTLKKCPKCIETRVSLADFWVKRGNFNEAINQLTEAKTLQPNSKRITYHLLKLMLEHHMYEPAKNELENLINDQNGADGDFACGECQHTQKDFFFQCRSCGKYETVKNYF